MEVLLISYMMLRDTPTHNLTLVGNAPTEALHSMKGGQSFGQENALVLMEVLPLTTAMRVM